MAQVVHEQCEASQVLESGVVRLIQPTAGAGTGEVVHHVLGNTLERSL